MLSRTYSLPMRRCALAILWTFAATLLAAPLLAQTPDPSTRPPNPASSTQSELPAEKASAEDKPLPRMEDLIALTKSRQSAAEELRKSYTYKQTVVADEFDSHGNKRGTHSDTYQTWMVKDHSVSQQMEHDGQPLPPDKAQKEQERVDREVAAIKDGSYKGPKGNVSVSVSSLLKVVTFSNERRVEVNGRPTILFDYKGNPDAKTTDLGQEIMKKLTGQLWLDEQDAALVRMQGALNESFHVAGGLLVNIKAGSHFDIDTSHINGEIWFPHHMQAHADGRFLLVKGFDGDANVTFSDYRKMRTSVTILPGSQVIGEDGKPIPTLSVDPAEPAQGAGPPHSEAATPPRSGTEASPNPPRPTASGPK